MLRAIAHDLFRGHNRVALCWCASLLIRPHFVWRPLLNTAVLCLLFIATLISLSLRTATQGGAQLVATFQVVTVTMGNVSFRKTDIG